MEDKDIFRTALFGGYQKEDVTDYIRSWKMRMKRSVSWRIRKRAI